MTDQQLWIGTVCEICGWKPALMAGRAGKLVKALREAGATPENLREHYSQVDFGCPWWWYRDDWRGKRGQRPDDGAIRATWGLWELPIAVQQQTAVGAMLEYARSLHDVNRSGSD